MAFSSFSEFVLPQTKPARRRVLFVGGLLLVSGLGIFMLYVSWLRWPDLLVDFGQEVYVPWRLSEGDLLYKDIAYIHGPFSVYFNAFWMFLFGSGLWTIFTVNIGLILVTAWLIYSLVSFLADPMTALVGLAVFLGMFAFGNYVGVSNYNFVAPYSHELLHGFIAGLFCLYALIRHERKRRNLWLFLAGLGFGITLLTKVEVALAATAVFFVFLLWRFVFNRSRVQTTLKEIVILLLGTLFPVAVFLAILVPHLSLSGAFSALVAPYKLAKLAVDQLTGANLVHLRWMGFTEPLSNLIKLAVASLLYLLLTTSILGVCYLAQRSLKEVRRYLIVILVGTLWLFPLMLLPRFLLLNDFFRPLPLVALTSATVGTVYLFRNKHRPEKMEKITPLILLSVFALVLMFKILLTAKIYHYGFILALPGTLILVVSLAYYLPKWSEKRGLDFALTRWLGIAFVAVLIVLHLQVSTALFRVKNMPLSTDFDTLIVRRDYRSMAIAKTLERLPVLLKPGETFAVMPEGVMLNYLTRTPTSLRYPNFLAIIFFGERAVLDNLRSNSPDYIIWVPRNTLEYGYIWGQPGFGGEIINWLTQHYQEVEKIAVNDGYTVSILKRSLGAQRSL